MQPARTLIAAFFLGLMFAGCTTSQHGARSPQADALLRAAREGQANTVKSLLVAQDVDVNVRDEQGNTPLIEAARNGHDDIVRTLLAAKADVRAKNNAGQTALMLALQGGHDQVVAALKQAGAVS